MERLGHPSDRVVQADALALAELKTAAEAARTRMLNGEDRDPDQLVRLENLVRRAERRLGLDKPVKPPREDFMTEMLRLATPQDGRTEARTAEGAEVAVTSTERTAGHGSQDGGAV
jgi:hypothetical protein